MSDTETADVQVPEIELDYRDFDPGDTNFIFHTWLKSYRKRVHTCPDRLYFPYQQALIARLCQRSRCTVACNKTDPSFILGYAIAQPFRNAADLKEPLVVHFAFTKLSYRRLGILRALLIQLGWVPGRPIHVSHWTFACREIEEAGKFVLINNPYTLMDVALPAMPHLEDRIRRGPQS